MTHAEFIAARQRLGLDVSTLAAELGLTPHVVEAFENGSVRVPARFSQELAWRVAVHDRQDALQSSGLPDCEWVARWEQGGPLLGKDRAARLDALERHHPLCPTCTARERFINERFGPLPTRPVPGWLNALGGVTRTVGKLPSWLRPAANGALLFFTISAARILLGAPRIFSMPDPWVVVVQALGISTVVGAVVGFILGGVLAGIRRWRSSRVAER